MNIYADRGNLIVLERRCAWRGIGFQLSSSGLGEPLDADAHDLFYIGGGQDRDQRLCAEDLLETKHDALHAAAARGAVVLGVCGGYQLLGHSYTLGEEEIAGVGLLDVRTVREDRAAPDRQRRDRGRDSEAPPRGGSRAGGLREPRRAHPLGAGQQPLGRVLKGHGNDGRSGMEGASEREHDRHLPARAAAAEERLVRRLADRPRARPRPGELAPLDDEIERQTHLSARRAAGV